MLAIKAHLSLWQHLALSWLIQPQPLRSRRWPETPLSLSCAARGNQTSGIVKLHSDAACIRDQGMAAPVQQVQLPLKNGVAEILDSAL